MCIYKSDYILINPIPDEYIKRTSTELRAKTVQRQAPIVSADNSIHRHREFVLRSECSKNKAPYFIEVPPPCENAKFKVNGPNVQNYISNNYYRTLEDVWVNLVPAI